jgi:hypothetical protein
MERIQTLTEAGRRLAMTLPIKLSYRPMEAEPASEFVQMVQSSFIHGVHEPTGLIIPTG